jgi:integrase
VERPEAKPRTPRHPAPGGVALGDLNAAHLNRLYADLLRDGRIQQPGGLSPTSVRRIHAMVRKALNDAVRWGLLNRNVALLADPPPLKVVRASRRRGMQTWSPSELRDFLASTREHELHNLWCVLAATGMRRSEILGLRWSEVDLVAGTLTVRQTILATADGFQPQDDQKSEGSARTIHLDRRTVAQLRAHRAAQNEAKLALGSAWQDNNLVFPRADGSWWNPPAISLAFHRAVKRAGVRPIRLQDVKHTHASLLLAASINPKVVSERLGHSSVAFTLDTYAHVMPGMQPEAAERFMELVHGAATDDEGSDEAVQRTPRRPSMGSWPRATRDQHFVTTIAPETGRLTRFGPSSSLTPAVQTVSVDQPLSDGSLLAVHVTCSTSVGELRANLPSRRRQRDRRHVPGHPGGDGLHALPPGAGRP